MLLDEMVYWHWWILAVVFVILEVFAPGTFFLWMGISAGISGFLLLLVPGMSWELQWSIFAVLSVASVIVWRTQMAKHPGESVRSTLNRRGEQYVGRVFTLAEPIVNGMGKIRVDDSTWKVEGQDCQEGVRIKVTGVDGVILRVEPVPED